MLLDQTCPACGLTEAAGSYCTRCLTPASEGWYHRPRQADIAKGRRPPSSRRKSALSTLWEDPAA